MNRRVPPSSGNRVVDGRRRYLMRYSSSSDDELRPWFELMLPWLPLLLELPEPLLELPLRCWLPWP